MQKKKKVMKSKVKPAKKATQKPNIKVAAKKATTPVKEILTKKEALKRAKKEVVAKAPAPKAETKPASLMQPTRVDTKNMSADALEHYKKWLKLQKQLGDQKAQEYKMTNDYEIKAPLSHKIHGWGVVMQRRDNYIDVLFEVGLKTLIVNYRSI